MNSHRWFFLMYVPLAWGACSLVHFGFPGDEYGLYFVSSLAGSWVCFFSNIGDIHQWWIPWSIAATGAAVMTGVGLALVRLTIQRWVWLAVFAAGVIGLLVLSLGQHSSLERAVAKNGSLLAYVCSSALMGSYVASALCLVLAPLVRWAKRKQTPNQ